MSKACDLKIGIGGMDCPDCALTIEKSVAKLPGVESVNVDFISNTLSASGDDSIAEKISIKVKSLGYEVRSQTEEMSGVDDGDRIKKSSVLAIASSALLVLAGGLFFHFSPYPLVGKALISAGVVLGGWKIGYKGLLSIRNFRLDINFLMLIAVTGAFVIGEWIEGGVVVVLFSFAQLLESHSLARSGQAIKALMDLTPDKAIIKKGDHDVTVDIGDIVVGDIVIVKPGEKIPVDGLVLSGISTVNQANITGEAVPVSRKSGDYVYAGTINGDGALEIESKTKPEDTKMKKIIRLVEESRTKRAPTQGFVEKFAVIYTPIVTLMAIIVAIVPPLFFGAIWIEWTYRALTLLVIACPCALVISTPVTIVSGLTNATRHGVLIKGGTFLENLHKMKTIAFDKTGTITKGRLTVHKIVPLADLDENSLLSIAASIEKRSQHPIGAALLRFAEENLVEYVTPDGFNSFPGKGVCGVIDGEKYYIGNMALIDEIDGLGLNGADLRQRDEYKAKTIVFVANSKKLLGFIVFADEARLESAATITELKSLGIQHTALLTGDNRSTAKEVCAEIGLDEYFAELFPESKVGMIEKMKSKYGSVVMVGDGVNDSPALAAADIGVAMGAIGSDAALETADIALMSDDLSRIPWAFRLSKKAYGLIIANIAMAIGIKVIFIGLASLGLATLWMAVFADMGVSLLVIFNGMRALKYA